MASANSRNATIDLLRGISIILVMILHFHFTYDLGTSVLSDWVPATVLRGLLVNGAYGVTMFFAISGFLITKNSISRWGALNAIDIRNFYRQRFVRIAPSLLLALVVFLLLAWFGWSLFQNNSSSRKLGLGNAAFSVVAIGSILTFWHNVLLQYVGWFNYALNIYWSLSVEEAFYLGFPLLCCVLRYRRWIILCCFVFILAAPLYRHMHREETAFATAYLACFDAIAMGVVAAIIVVPMNAYLRRMIQLGAVVLLVGAFYRGIAGNEVFGYSLVALATAILLMLASAVTIASRSFVTLPVRALAWMGRHSYELYLFHMIVLGVMYDLLIHRPGPVEKLAFGAVFFLHATVVAWAVARFWGETTKRWLRKQSWAAFGVTDVQNKILLTKP